MATFSVSVDSAPAGRGFSRHEGLSSDDFLRQRAARREEPPALLSIGSMSPPGYPSAWLHPCSARFRFTRQIDFSSAAPRCSQLPSSESGLPNKETPHHVGSCCKPAFILEVWVARTVVVVAAGGLRAGRYRSSAGTRPSDRSDPSDGRRR
jgi:hypothetical protein